MIDSWVSSIHSEHPFALEVVVIGDQLLHLEVVFLQNKFLINLLIAPLTKKLLYNNADEWMEKLLEVFWAIPGEK